MNANMYLSKALRHMGDQYKSSPEDTRLAAKMITFIDNLTTLTSNTRNN